MTKETEKNIVFTVKLFSLIGFGFLMALQGNEDRVFINLGLATVFIIYGIANFFEGYLK